MEDIDVWKAATILINAHGLSGASSIASHRSKKFREKGDAAAVDVWKRVESAIEELEKIQFEPRATMH